MTSIVKGFFKISLRFEFILLIYLTEQLRRSISVEELEVSLEFLLLLLLLALRQMSMQQEVGVQKEEAVKAAITPIRHFLCDAIRAQWQPIHLKHKKKTKKTQYLAFHTFIHELQRLLLLLSASICMFRRPQAFCSSNCGEQQN